MTKAIQTYNQTQEDSDQEICNTLAKFIDGELPESTSKIWHGHPVWFLSDNPIVGYSKQKAGLRLMFWSGASFDETGLSVRGKKFKDASVYYTSPEQINPADLKRWLQKAQDIQWDYKNIVKRKGQLLRLK
ncbi:hypothetical protein C1T31_10335 [Hanstruepera neustonica]|uniref:YdhG-like domain-containing protein n=1 Tax=Hanstruepera neustonica TaxID=1445657 RepID=A0A2K1DWY5_9FLAO|nr:DUF1801 domain-containing protein [Hanstruepera neustonica]PNQ72545.1 hypothetical protein C1T31_10335 [Hanstruepera neustonica]